MTGTQHAAKAVAGILVLLFLFPGLITPAAARAEGAGASSSALDSMVTIPFTEDTETVLVNPERGWYREFTTDDMEDVDSLKAQGIGNIMMLADLGAFKTAPISAAKLQEIRDAFARARMFGLSVIFRAAYDFEGESEPEPHSLSIITNHIAQLKPIFFEYEDILFCVQAGFLGPWGEWHSSYYGDPPSLSARKAVMAALMDAVPKSRQIEVRRPMFIRDMYPGQSLTPSTAFQKTDLARTGYHNDSLLSSEDDNGTYVDPGYSRQMELDWADNHNRYTPFVAESSMLSSYSDPGNAVYELGKLHAQMLNDEYYPSVLAKWKNTTTQGVSTYHYISQHMGYRFVLSKASVNSGLARGGALHLVLCFQNTGFANLINARDFQIVLSNGVQFYTASVNDDARTWTKDKGMMTKDLYFSIPSGIALGSWSVSLNMPNLSNAPACSIRFANQNTWNAAKGTNLICTASINSTQPNSVSAFRQISRAEAEALVMAAPAITASPLSYSSIKVSWNLVGSGLSYQLYRATSATGAYSLIATTTSASYTDTGAATGTTYYYKARAYRPSGSTAIYGPFSNTVSAKAMVSAPGSVKAVSSAYNAVRITWGAAAGSTNYEVWRSTSKTGAYSLAGTTGTTTFLHTGAVTGTTYYYKVRACRLVSGVKVYSGYSAVVSAQPALLAPMSVKAVMTAATSVKISWGAVAGATGYEIWNATANKLIATTSRTYYTNAGLAKGRAYSYKVRAYRLVGTRKVYGGFSLIVTIKL